MQMLEPRLDFGSIARNPTESVRPDLWPDHAWVPALGNQGDRLFNVAGSSDANIISGDWGHDSLVFDGSNTRVQLPSFQPPKNFSLVFVVSADTQVEEYVKLIDWENDSYGFQILIEPDYDDAWMFVTNTSSGQVKTYSTEPATNAGENVVIATYDGISQLLCIDNVRYSSSQTGNVDYTGLTNLQIGNRGTDLRHFKGNIRVAFLFDKALSPPQITDLSADPLLPFRRAPQVSYFIAAGLAIPIILNQTRRRRT